jgi:hypothetical protein
MLLTNWLGTITSRIKKRRVFRSRDRRDIRKRWQSIVNNQISTTEVLEDRTMLTAPFFYNTGTTPTPNVTAGDSSATIDIPYYDFNGDPIIHGTSDPTAISIFKTGSPATPVSVVSASPVSGAGTYFVTVRYTFDAPAGTWTSADDGTYVVNMNGGIIGNSNAEYISSGYLFSFNVDLNSPPTSTNNTVTTDEDIAYTFSASDFNYSDVDGDPLGYVRIAGLPTAGALKLNGVDVSTNQAISKANIDAGLLKFTSVANANGAGYASFGFGVYDGKVFSVASSTMTIDVTAVNDAPTMSSNSNRPTKCTLTCIVF